ncbi:MAG TPA: hypothetical protein VF142_17470 [Longimicrobium sp.]
MCPTDLRAPPRRSCLFKKIAIQSPRRQQLLYEGGGLILVLRRNQRDLHDLQAGRVPPEVDRALGGAPPPE